MTRPQIVEGDFVTVEWGHGQCSISGIVRYAPCATGDSWAIENERGLYYVQSFEVMTKLKEQPTWRQNP